MPGQLYVISGPSGVGKSAIITGLRKKILDLEYSISHTTRKPRSTEANGVNYHFVDRETFREMIGDGAFVEWAEIYNDYYGTSFSGLRDQTDRGLDVLMDLDSQGAKNIKEQFEESVLIYVLPPSLEILETRLRERAKDDEKVINTRIEKALKELKDCVWYPYLIINDDLNRAVGAVESIITSERCSNARMLPKVKEMLGL
ncbi:MAG: guanylate kinase [Candidatus Binatia bacterium]